MTELIYIPGHGFDDSDVEIRKAKLEQSVAAELASELHKHYPLRDWTIEIDTDSKVAIIKAPDISSQKGYVLHLSRTMNDLRGQMKRVGGEILERGGLSRAKVVDEEDVEYLPRDFRDEVRTVDTDAPEEANIRAQRAANKA